MNLHEVRSATEAAWARFFRGFFEDSFAFFWRLLSVFVGFVFFWCLVFLR